MRRNLTEHDIQVQIVAYLDLALPADQRIVSVSNNPRSQVTGGREKARGMRAGFPDLILVGRITGLLEVKRPGQRVRPNQVEWGMFCCGAGMNHAVVHSTWEAIEVISRWGVKLSDRVHL